MKKLIYFLFLSPALINAQRNLPLNREWGLENESYRDLIQAVHHDSSLLRTEVRSINFEKYVQDPSSFKPFITRPFKPVKNKSEPWIYRKLKLESAIVVIDSNDNFNLSIDPLLGFEFGIDGADKRHEALYKNTRGFLLRGDIGDKISFESSFYENQSTFPSYVDEYIKNTDDLFPQTQNYNYNVVPGQGRSKQFRLNGYDYAMASGYVSYSPNNFFNIQVGHGKHFVGDGYRSLLLSDNSFNYPYARITTSWRNFQYTNLYTSFMNLTNGGASTPARVERLFQKKTASFQMLSANFFRRLQLGLFQGMIFKGADTMNSQHLNFHTFNPVIGVNSALYGLDNENNILWGATFKFKIFKSLALYGQYMLDDLPYQKSTGRVNKSGYQIGFKYHNMFTLRNLNFQLEYNTVNPYSYSATNSEQSYTHYNQALAHPLGANFKEAVGFLNYTFSDFFIQFRASIAERGIDTLANQNFGGNIFRSDVNATGQSLSAGLKTTIIYEDILFGYLINPASNLNLYIGFSNRYETTYRETKNTVLIFLGLRTSLSNFYYDF